MKTPNKKIKFICGESGLYYFKPHLDKVHNMFVTTLEENNKFYTPRQLERAKIAHDFYLAMGTPSLTDLKSMLQMNMIKNNPITNEDVDLAENFFGPDVGTIKGKIQDRGPVQ